MALYLDSKGRLVESDATLDELGDGYSEPTTEDLQRHNSGVDYDEKGLAGQAAETIGAGVKGAIRGAEAGMDALGLDTGVQRDEHGNPVPGMATEGLYGQEAQFEGERHPFATGVGQAALAAPLGLGAGAAVGGLAGVGAGLAAESAAGGYASEAENAWLEDRDFSQEAALTNVGAGLLVGGGIMGAGAVAGAAARGVRRIGGMGRNLLTEAEHGASARAARDLLDEAPSQTGAKSDISAEEIARRGPDDAGVTYLRENADRLADELSTKQAKAAQDLLDAYGEMAPLRQTREQVDELIPDAAVEQARWVSQAKRDTLDALDGLPTDVASAARERLATLGDGGDPAVWFTESSEVSDELLRATAKARRAGEVAPELADRLSAAKKALDDGLKDEGLWGGAAKFEGQRAAGYARRYGEHIDTFESTFAPGGKTDPAAFRRALMGEADPAALKALSQTLESARATADVAVKFGRKKEAARILGAVSELERTARQGGAVLAATRTVSRATKSATQKALEWLAREGARGVTEEAVETGFKGAGAVIGGTIAGPPGAIAGWLGGRWAAKRFTDPIAEGIAAGAGRAAERAAGDKLTDAAAGALGRVRARAGGEGGAVRLGKDAELDAVQAQLDKTYGKDGWTNEGQKANWARQTGLYDTPGAPAAPAAPPKPSGTSYAERMRAGRSPEEQALRDQLKGAAGNPKETVRLTKQLDKLLKQKGSVELAADGPNFSLGDVASSPIGVTTGVGAAGVGARELYLAVKDDSRQSAFRGVVDLARATKASLTRSVNSLLSRPAEGQDDGVRIQPPAQPRITSANYDATRDHIDRMASEPAYFADVMAASFGNMPESAPEVYSALSAEAAKTVQYLAAVAPGGSSGGPFGQRFPVGSDELWEFNERARALTDPDFIPEELAAGRLSSQAIEAYELMRPKQYAHLQRTVFERLQELNEQGVPVTVAAREQLDVLLNIDGGGDPALTWKVAERAYAAQARKAASASARDPGGGGDSSDAMQSGALSTLSNGASAIAQTG